MSHIKIPSDGTKITVNNDGTYNIPDNPIVTLLKETNWSRFVGVCESF